MEGREEVDVEAEGRTGTLRTAYPSSMALKQVRKVKESELGLDLPTNFL